MKEPDALQFQLLCFGDGMILTIHTKGGHTLLMLLVNRLLMTWGTVES